MSHDTDPAASIVGFARHPAGLGPAAPRTPAYPEPVLRSPSPGVLAWNPAARFAPPGPAALSQRALDVAVLLTAPSMPKLPSPTPKRVERPTPPPLPPSPPPARPAPPAAELTLPEPPSAAIRLAPEQIAVQPPPVPHMPPAAEWVELVLAPPRPASPGESVAERPAWLVPEAAPARLETAADEPPGPLWPAEPMAGRRRTADRASPSTVAGVAAGVAVLALIAAGLRYGPGWLASGSIPAVFNAPMMVVRAAGPGRVTVVAANAGQLVDPKSPLLTIHSNAIAGPDQSVLAGVHGVIRSVETVPGADLAAGSPLVRLHDCDRAFLTVPQDAKLAAGDTVRVKLPTLPAITGTVRPSAGIMEPPDSLVVGLPSGAMDSACPVGATADVTAAAKG